MRKLNSFETRNLIGERNSLKVLNQDFRFNFNSNYNFTGIDFSFSMLIRKNSSNPNLTVYADAGQITVSWTSGLSTIVISIPGLSPSVQIQSLSNQPLDSWVRITFIKSGSTFKCYSNKKLGSEGTLGNPNINFVGLVKYGGDGFQVDGYFADLIWFNSALTYSDVEYLTDMGIPPKATHVNIISHYRLNEVARLKAYDSVEQYNYSKVTALTANHADLINYTNDEAGITNELIQTARHNFYRGKKEGNYFLKFNGTSGYAEIPTYAPNPPQWTLSIVGFHQNINAFKTLFAASEINADFAIFFGGLNNASAYYNGVQVMNLFCPLGLNYFIFTYDGTNFKSYLNGVIQNSSVQPNQAFSFVRFFRQNAANNLYTDVGTLRAVLLDRVASDRELNILNSYLRSNDIYSIPNKQFDLDFGDVFLDSGNYFARDNSGNNRHARLYNWVPATDQPLLINSSSGFPKPKALRLIKASSHNLKVTGFLPTSEKGYTFIVGFALNSDRDFSAAYEDVLMAIRGSGNAIVLFGDGVATRSLSVISQKSPGAALVFLSNPKTNLSRQIFLCLTFIESSNSDLSIYLNGFKNGGSANPSFQYPSINNFSGNLYLGSDDTDIVSRFLDGYLTFAGVWKGNKKEKEILNIIQSDLNPYNNDLLLDSELLLFFEGGFDDAGTIKMKDWSLQNRTVVMNNYTANDINPAHPNYKFVEVDTLK